MNVSTIKKVSRKSLSVFLAVLMLMSTMSVSFGTFALAAGGNVPPEKWAALVTALKNDTVKDAAWNTETELHYSVTDPDGTIIDVVELYFEIFNTLADKNPASSADGNRTINQVNSTIKNTLAEKMGEEDYLNYGVGKFIENMISGATVSADLGPSKEGQANNNTTTPGTDLPDIAPVKLTVFLGGELLRYNTIDDLPEQIATSKTFTVEHTKDRFDVSEGHYEEGSCGSAGKQYYNFAHYYSISSVTSAEGEKQSVQVLKDSAKTFSDNSDYLNADKATMINFIKTDAIKAAAVQKAINDAKANAVKFSQAAWNQYFSADYDERIAAFNSTYAFAEEILYLEVVANELNELKKTDYDELLKDEVALRKFYSDLTVGLSKYRGGTYEARTYFENDYSGVVFDPAEIELLAKTALGDIYLIELRRLKDEIDKTTAPYYSYSEEMITAGTLTGETVVVAKGNVDGFITAINTYPLQLVSQVMRGYNEMLTELSDNLAKLIAFAGVEDFSVQYAKYVAEIYSKTSVEASTEDLIKFIETGYDEWYAGFSALLNENADKLGDGVAAEILAEKDAEMKDRIGVVYETLEARVEAELDNAIALYEIVAKLNGKIDLITLNNYAKYKIAFEDIRKYTKETYEFLLNSADFDLSEGVIKKYNSLNDDFSVYEKFIASGGFSAFNRVFGEYENREPLENDIVRDENNIFEVNGDKVEAVITGIDNLIASEDVSKLLGSLLAAEGEEAADFDIATMIKDLLADAIFSDATINSIMQMLYPLVLTELIKVWEKDLPTKITDPVTANITYNKTIAEISREAGLPLFPRDVADYLDPANHADNIAMLKTASENYKSHPEYKADGSIDKIIVDETPWTEKNPDLFNDDGTLKLTWGVDAAKAAGAKTEELAEAFYQGFDDAMHCLKPLLNVLVANTKWESNQVRDVASISAKVVFTINDNAHLTIGAEACPGYANLIVPIFEALGGRVEGTKDALFTFSEPSKIEGYAADYAANDKLAGFKTDNSAADMLRDIFNPIFGFIDTLGGAPLSTVVGILPNLCYALYMQMVSSLLGTLETKLSIGVELNNSTLQGCVGGMLQDILPSMDLNVGDMLDINDLIDLRNGVNSLFALLGIPLPEIDQSKVAQMGKMGKFESARYGTHYDKNAVNSATGLKLTEKEALTITTDKGAVMNYLLQYIFGILKDEEAFKGILGLLMTKDVPVLDENGAPTYDDEDNAITEAVPDEEKIAETIESFNALGLFKHGVNNAIAAVVELFSPDETLKNAHLTDWYKSRVNPNLGTEPAPFTTVYLKYGNDWTEQKAMDLIDILPDLLAPVLEKAGLEGDMDALLKNVLSAAFTTETVTTLILGIAGIGAAPELADLGGLLDGVLGADFDAMYKAFGYLLPVEEPAEGEEPAPAPLKPGEDGYVNETGIEAAVDAEGNITWTIDGTEFVDGNRDTFLKLVIRALGAFVPTIHKLISGDTISVLNAININCAGVYTSSLQILLGDVLGIDVPNEADLAAKAPEDALLTLVDVIFDWIESKTIVELLELAPNLLYFIESNGLSVVIRNLLHPILVLLDTIRPIVDIGINSTLSHIISELINGKEFTLDIMALLSGKFPVPEDPENYKEIRIDIRNLRLTTILKIVDAAIGTNLLSSHLVSPGLDAMFAYTAPYTYANGDAGYKATTSVYDAVTVLVSALFEALNDPLVPGGDETNADAIFALIEDPDLVKTLSTVLDLIAEFAELDYTYEEPDWDYLVSEGEALSGLGPVPSIEYLDYKATDWTEDKAEAVYGALDEILVMVLPEILKESGAENLAAFVNDMLTASVFTDENLNMIVEGIANLLVNIDASLFELLDVMLDTDISSWFSEDMIKLNEETGKYECIKDWGIAEAEDKKTAFVDALLELLEGAEPLLAFLLFGDSYEFFTGSKQENNEYVHNSIITINGGAGYDRGIVPIFTALGFEMKDAAEYLGADGKYDVTAAIKDILDDIFGLIDKLETAESTVKVVMDLLPNLIYFINADGLKSSVNNILAPIDTLIGKVAPLIPDLEGEASIGALIGEIKIGETATLNITDLSTKALIDIAVASGVTMTPELAELVTKLYVGEFESYTYAADENGALTGYRLDVEGYEDHVLTIVLSLVLDIVKQNANLFTDLLGEDIYAVINALLTPHTVNYQAINWGYMYGNKDEEGNVDIDANNAALADGFKAVPKFQYLKYATDWTPETANEVYSELNSVITYALGEFADGNSIAQLLQGVMEDKVYTEANLKTVVELLVNALASLDRSLAETIGILLDADISTWFDFCEEQEVDGETKYVCTKVWGVDTAADKKAVFVDAIQEILVPANRLLNWLFFEGTFTFFKDATGETLITLTGGKGYELGIVPILEALGCDVEAAETFYDAQTGLYDVGAAVESILDSVLALVDEISANPAKEAMTLIPNLLYFINADGLKASVNNLLAPVEVLLSAFGGLLSESGEDVTLSSLIDFELDNLSTETLLGLLEGEDVGFVMNDDMKAVIENIFALGVAEAYTSANGKTAYRVDVTGKEYDVLTVVLSFAIDAFKLNKPLFEDLLPEGVYDAVVALIAGINIDADPINWAYMYSGNMDELERKGFPAATIKYLDYSTDWTAEVADSVYAALADILDLVLPLVLEDKDLYNLVNDLIAGNLYKTENLETIVELIVNLLAGFDESLRNVVDAVLDVNIASWFSMCEVNADGKYEVIPGKLSGNNRKDFIAGLKTVLEPAEALLNWLFFGESYTFFNGTTSEVLITVNGGKGYAYGILPILEALGVKGLQKEYRDADGKLSTTLAVEDILNKVLDLVDANLKDSKSTVEFVFTLIPNLLYFINADGLKASVNNLVAPVDAIIGCLSDVVGAESIAALLTETLGFDISNLETRTLLTLLEEKTGFVMNPGMRGAIYNIYEVGKAQKFTSENGKPAYKLVPDMGDALTVILSFALDAFNLNEELFADLLGEEVYSTVATLIKGLDVLYTDINWGYMYEKDSVEANNKALAEGGFPAVSFQYLEYSTDWTPETAEKVYGELNGVVAYLLGEFAGGNTIAQLLSGILNNNVYTDANLNAIVELIVNAIFSLDEGLVEIIGGVDSLLDADINVWKNMCTYNETTGKYECTKAWGVDGAADEKAAFVAGLKEVLAPANELLAWLFFEDDYTFFNGTTNNPLITISGGKGYELGLVPILEALGCEMAPAESFYDDVTETYDVGAAVESILNSALKLVDKVSENPAKEAMTLIPNLLYFINADGLKESVNNLLAPVNAVISALSGIVDVDSLGALLEKVVGFNVENLSTETLLGLLTAKTGFVMNEDMKQVIYDIYGLGTADDFTSANGKIAYRVDVCEYDALTAILSFAIDAFKLNKALFAGLLPEGVYDAIVELIAGINIDAAPINWAYMYSGNMDELERKGFPGATIKYLEYSTDWTADAADSVYAVLDDVLTLVLDAVIENGDLKKLVNDLIAGNLYKTENLETIVELIVNLLAGFDESLRNVVDAVLDVNIASWFSMCEVNADGKYEVIPGKLKGDTRADFIAGLKTVLKPAEALLNWLFFGESYTFFNGTTSEVLITVNGGKGYAYGILPILEALGVEGLQKEYRDADGKLSTTLAVEDILNKVLDLVDTKLTSSEKTVEFAFTLIPNLLYFINADGLKVSVNNLVAPVDAVIRTLSGVIGEESLAALLTDVIGIDISNLETRTLLTLLEEKTGFVMNPGMRGAIYNIYEVGKAQKFTSVNGKPAYKLVPDMGDALTVILSFALDAFNLNRDIFADLLGEENYDAVYNLIRGAKDQFVYQEIDWGYMYEGAELADRLAALEAASGKMPKYPENTTAANYLLYKNNWNKDTAKYVNEVVDSVIAGIMGETSLGQMLDDAITNGFYTDGILNSLISLVVGFAIDYAEIIEGAGVLLGAESINKWFDYCTVAEDGTVTVTHDFGVDEAATNDDKREKFVEAFVEVLEPAYDLLAWLLFDQEFTFFNGTTNDPLITLTGGRGYEEALVPLFEAVGAKMPGLEDKKYENGETAMKPASAYVTANGVDMETFVFDIFSALTGWLSQICGDLANQGEYGVIGAMLDLLPNIIYNLNAGTVKAVVNNLLLPVEEILGHLKAFGLTVDFSTLVEIRGQALDITDLDWYSVFDIVESFRLYWPEKIQDFLATLYIGEAVAYKSANGKTAYYMTYNADDKGDYLVSGREDMITLVISFVIDGVLDKRNAPRLSGWLGEDAYNVIYRYLANEIIKVPMQDIDWALLDPVNYADTGIVISPITLGAKINSEFYGELYTREMGEYIEKWLPSFVDSMIVLLGVQSADGTNYEGLSDILNELIGTSLYTKENLQKILDLIKSLIPKAEEALGAELFEVVVNVLDKALDIDLTYWNDYTVADIATGDREAFVDELTRMLAPLYPVLSWLLTDEDLVALFYTAEGRDALVIEGAEGYAYGIIPLLEAFDYDSEKILTPEEFKAASTDAPSMLKNILNPVLDVVDTVLADPVNEIFNVLPGVIYFLNSNGLDTVIKNTANAVFTVLENIEPLTGEIDIYELIGFDAENINIETLISELIKGLEEDTGFQLTDVAMEALKELTVGKLISFTSKNGKTAYTVEYATGADRVDMVTVVLRTVLTFVSIPENVVALEGMLEGKLNEDGYKFLCSLLENFSQMAAKTDENGNKTGMDEIMYTVYQIFYAANVAAHSTEDWLAEFNGDYSFLNQLFKTSNLDFLRQIEVSLGDLLNKYTGDIIDDDEIVPNGFIAFFQKIADFFKKIGEFFKNLFK